MKIAHRQTKEVEEEEEEKCTARAVCQSRRRRRPPGAQTHFECAGRGQMVRQKTAAPSPPRHSMCAYQTHSYVSFASFFSHFFFYDEYFFL